MTQVIDAAVTALNAKLAGGGFDGTAKFVIEDEGTPSARSSTARSTRPPHS